jgi:tetraacyldisaccharide 4'-kinase
MRAPEWWRRRGLRSTLLLPASFLFDLAGVARRSWSQSERAPLPVICIGNLTVGGAGKTPVALGLFERLRERGIAAHFVTRGYRGQLAGPVRVEIGRHDHVAVGDEALLLAAAGPTWVSRRRIAGARSAAAAGAAAVILDDGLQNPGIIKDLSLVVVDAGYGFGNKRVLPAGPLRETLRRGAARADGIVLVGQEELDLSSFDRPVFRASLVSHDGPERWKGHRVLAFAGIGRPAKFFETLRSSGAEIVEARAFPDHHVFTIAERTQLAARARALSATLVTTAKDFVRLPTEFSAEVTPFHVSLKWHAAGDLAGIDRLLDRIPGL